MKRQPLFLGLLAGLALLGLCCAPHEDPAMVRKGNGGAKPAEEKKESEVPAALEPRIAAALEEVHSRDMRTTNGFWTIFHGILGMGPATTLLDDSKTPPERLNALDAICKGYKLRGLEFKKTEHGLDVVTQIGSGVFQGHQDQFIAEMAQWNMPRDRPFLVDGKQYTFEDFTRQSKMRASVDPKREQELSWAIVIVAQYYGTKHRWTNAFGEQLSLEDIVRYELNQPIDKAACGGTHRLFGLTWALHLHLAGGGKLDGVWAEVAAKINEYKGKALTYQNEDGSFSTPYLAGQGKARDPQQRLNTTGHVLEWLALAMTDEELRLPRVQEAASALAAMILTSDSLDGGSLYHATHGLHIYRTRVFRATPPEGLLIPRPNRS
jgi:hypothetical protein